MRKTLSECVRFGNQHYIVIYVKSHAWATDLTHRFSWDTRANDNDEFECDICMVFLYEFFSMRFLFWHQIKIWFFVFNNISKLRRQINIYQHQRTQLLIAVFHFFIYSKVRENIIHKSIVLFLPVNI